MRKWSQGIGVAFGCTAVLVAGGTTGARAAVPLGPPASDALPAMPEQVDADAGCTPASKKTVTLTPWAQQLLGLRRAQELSLGDGVTVGVVDTGVDTGTAVLKGRASGDGKRDCVGHGTFTAALVAGARRDGTGFTGVAPHARVFGVRATTAEGATDADAIAAGIEAAVRGGCDVVLVSVAYGASSKRLKAAVETAAERDVVVVAPAAGGQRSGAPAYPAALPGVVGVASVGVDGGPYPSGRDALPSPPDLVAPGDRVLSVGPGGGHFTGGGDAVAAAFVAGAAALVRAHEPELSAEAVVARLRATAVRSAGPVPDPLAGYGLVDPAEALSGVAPGTSSRAAAPTGDGDGKGTGGGEGARDGAGIGGGAGTGGGEGTGDGRGMRDGEGTGDGQGTRDGEGARDGQGMRDGDGGSYRVPERPEAMSPLAAWGVVGGSASVAVLAAVLGAVVPRGRARGWQPGNRD
ncbi:S8 family serine peptidase [Streptomyces sp. NPDC003247]|uniref:S8 family serine peptidase n=1 Tax=Streptomyces sp. NPDC003247 TaxID=3364677 RepID=UPI0036818089